MQPIGVFDSGMGGLTVLRALCKTLPNESFLYLGDTARLPYGSKSPATVSRYAIQAAQALKKANVKLMVVACNTASAVALADLRAAFAPIDVIGVVEPGALAAVQPTESHSSTNSVLVLATESTVAGGAYARAIHRHNKRLAVYSRACPLLVALAEEGRVDDAVVKLVLEDYLAGFLSPRRLPDTLLLGCTHFPVFRDALRRLLPAQVRIVDSASTTAAAVVSHLQRTRQAAVASSTRTVQFLATDGRNE